VALPGGCNPADGCGLLPVVRHHTPDAGQNAVGIELVEGAEDPVAGRLKISWYNRISARFYRQTENTDWTENTKKPEFLKRYLRLHAFSHPKIALKNAKDEFELNELEQEMILKHMWPVTIALPRHIETYIITIADKLCAINESVEFYKRQEKIRMAYMYAFLFSCVLNTVTCIVI